MKNLSFALCLCVGVFLTGCDSGGADGGGASVAGHVYEWGSTTPVANARVTLADQSQTTGASGAFAFSDVPTGRHAITASKDGFALFEDEVRFVAGENALDIGLVPPETAFQNIEFVHIPGGTFMMGSDRGATNERPVHEVTLRTDFWIGKYEITQGQYTALAGENPSVYTGSDDLPVNNISWLDAPAFANLVSAAEGVELCYDSNGREKSSPIYNCKGFRLPTEAEWEYVARAGTTTEYIFGDDIGAGELAAYAWYLDTGGELHPVGTKLPNPWGVYDMYGSLWERTNDYWSEDYYSVSPSENPSGPATSDRRTGRGGCFGDGSNYLRSSYRGMTSTDLSNQSPLSGIRLVRSIW